MANGKDWTESGEIELPKKKPTGWTRFIRPVWWSFLIVVGIWSFFRASKDVKAPDSTKHDAAARDAGGE